MMEYDNSSSDIIVEIEETKHTYIFLYDYVAKKYVKPHLMKHDDDLLDEGHPSPPFHDTLFHNIP